MELERNDRHETDNNALKWLAVYSNGAGAPPALLPQDWEEVTLPHTWNNLDGQDGGSDYYRGPCWYCRALSIPVPADGGRIYLEFQGANSICEVYLNGQKAARLKAVFRPSVRILRPI